MNFAILLCSGKGTRIKSQNVPKQFIYIKNKPIFLYTLNNLLKSKLINHIFIVLNHNWKSYLKNKDIIKIIKQGKISICIGGNTRNDSIKNALIFYKNNFDISLDDIFLIHDGARVFVSEKIINNNIKIAKKFNNAITSIKSKDTILKIDEKNVQNFLDKTSSYMIQTPQTFKFVILKNLYFNSNFNDSLWEKSDTCSLLNILNKQKIFLVDGLEDNFKLTTDFDLKILKRLIN